MEDSKISIAREKYKPEHIKLLLVGEAPPDNVERFFYYEYVKDHDHLFVEFVKTLCDEKFEMNVKKLRSRKGTVLKYLKAAGFFLMDLSDAPCGDFICVTSPDNIDAFVAKLADAEAVDKETTDIILVKAGVYKALFSRLKSEGYNVQPVRVPFPSSGNQADFRVKMREALKNTDFNTEELSRKIMDLF